MVRLRRLLLSILVVGGCLYLLIIPSLDVPNNEDDNEFSQEVEEFLKRNGGGSSDAYELRSFDSFESRKTLIEAADVKQYVNLNVFDRKNLRKMKTPNVFASVGSYTSRYRSHSQPKLNNSKQHSLEFDAKTEHGFKEIGDSDNLKDDESLKIVINHHSDEVVKPALSEKENGVMAKKQSWLYNHPNIVINDVVSEDLLPSYFDTSGDMTAQYVKYHNLTKLIMQRRQAKISELCLKKSRYLRTERKFLYNFPEVGLTWCPTFKCGSTNWKQFFCKMYKPEIYEQYLFALEDPFCPLESLIPYKYNTAKDKIQWTKNVKTSLKFMTARHPYERLVSVYNNKFRGCIANMFTNNLMVQILKKYRPVDGLTEVGKIKLLDEAQTECHKPASKRKMNENNPYMNPMGVTFREFIQFITSQQKRGESPDYHWIPITKSCDLCMTTYDVIEKFETLERDHHYIFSLIGKEHLYSEIAGSHTNPSGNSSNDLVSYFSTLDEYLLWDLYAIYRDDFELFGYKPNFRLRKNPKK